MKKYTILIVVILLLGMYGGYRYVSREKAIAVSMGVVETGLVEATVANTRAGSVKARQRANLAPAIGGQIASLEVEKADVVKAGQVLLTLWNKDLQAELLFAKSELVATEAAARESCLLAEFTDKQARRQVDLRKKRATSESNYDQAITNSRAQRAACEAAGAKRAVSQARIAAAQATLERTILTAPFDGIVAEVNGEVGEYITPSPPGIATLPAVDLINRNSLYIAAPIDEIDAAQIRTGMEVRISLDAFPRQSFAGKVYSISPYVLEVAKQARTVEIEAEFVKDAAPENLLVGYSADVEIILAARSSVVRIPSEAIVQNQFVYVWHPKSGRVEHRQVTTGLANWKYTEITSGLQQGEQIVTTIDRQGLQDGALVVVEQRADQP